MITMWVKLHGDGDFFGLYELLVQKLSQGVHLLKDQKYIIISLNNVCIPSKRASWDTCFSIFHIYSFKRFLRSYLDYDSSLFHSITSRFIFQNSYDFQSFVFTDGSHVQMSFSMRWHAQGLKLPSICQACSGVSKSSARYPHQHRSYSTNVNSWTLETVYRLIKIVC